MVDRITPKIEPREIEPFCSVKGCNNDGMHKVLGEWYCFDCYASAHTKEDFGGTPIPRQGLYDLHTKTCAAALDLMRTKNEDYAAADDPYRNFRTFGRYGILVRLSDKLARLRTFEERGVLSVKDESIEDTIRDIINYSILYLGYK